MEKSFRTFFSNMSQHLGVDLLKVNEGSALDSQTFFNGLSFLPASEKVPQGLYGSKLSRKLFNKVFKKNVGTDFILLNGLNDISLGTFSKLITVSNYKILNQKTPETT